MRFLSFHQVKRIFIFFVFILFTCTSCTFVQTKTKAGSRRHKKPLILVSIVPYQHMLEQIASDSIDVRCVLPVGADPHSWEPTVKDLSSIQDADVWFTIGEHFEGPLIRKLQEKNPSIQIIPIANTLTFIEQNIHGHDTHYWLDPINDIETVDLFTNTLLDIPKLTQYKEEYLHKKKSLVGFLENLDRKLSVELQPFSGDILIATHGAYTYFCARYQLKQITIETSEGKEPLTRDLAQLFKYLQQERHRLIAVFTEPGHSSKAAKAIAQQFNLPLYPTNPYDANYIETIETLAKNIIIAKDSYGQHQY